MGGTAGDTTTIDNAVLGNSIFLNPSNAPTNAAAIGIDLGNNGVTANQGNPASFPNQGQNWPVLNYAIKSGTTTVINATLTAQNSTSYRIEFFDNPAGIDKSGNGEGQTLLAVITVTTSNTGTVTFHLRPASAG